jgi:1-acyl-sn-glycerol-3-phosphate acyltransferase
MVWFMIVFLCLYPALWLSTQRKEWHYWNGFLYRIWAKILYFGMGIKMETEWEFEPQKKQNYIYTSNHTSYLDISAMVMTVPNFSVFMGKASLSKTPLFGYIFKKIHIPVSRGQGTSRIEAFEKVKEALAEGKNVLIYPEGGIFSKNPPELSPFKDGAFRAAIQTNISLVPVTILYNWIIFPDKQPFKFTRHYCKMIYHKPIETINLNDKDIEDLRNKTFELIDSTIKKHTI